MILVVAVIFSVLSVLYILYPIFLKKAKNETVTGKGVEEQMNILIKQKKQIYSLLKDLEFEYETNKISKKDFEKLREEYKIKAILIIKEIKGQNIECKN
ncbi:MAG: hypothetical protein AB1498_01325 [bacterium]